MRIDAETELEDPGATRWRPRAALPPAAVSPAPATFRAAAGQHGIRGQVQHRGSQERRQRPPSRSWLRDETGQGIKVFSIDRGQVPGEVVEGQGKGTHGGSPLNVTSRE